MALKTNPAPTLELEQQLFNSGFNYIAGVDEVGRGALAGPVSVGVAVVSQTINTVPEKLRDSKLISKSVRENLVPVLQNWVTDYAIGHASPQEIDDVGIIGALRLAWQRAYAQLELKPDHIILDGKHNWLIAPDDLLSSTEIDVPVTVKIKADQHCAAVAAASVLAKVTRDLLMVEADRKYPEYGFAGNVGYGSSAHLAAIRDLGATDFHRRSWKLPTKNQ